MKRFAMAFGILGFAAGATAAPAQFPGHEKVSAWVKARMLTDDDRMPVMIMLKEKADLSAANDLTSKNEKGAYVYNALRKVALTSQVDVVNYLKSKNVEFERFHILNMVAIYNANEQIVQELAARADVAKVIGNPSFHGLPLVNKDFTLDDETAGIEQALVSTGAKQVCDELRAKGEGIVVASQDTGVQWDHPALKRQYRGFDGTTASHDYNWFDAIQTRIGSESNPCGAAAAAPCDDNAHGSHTVGTMVGDDGQGNQIGMAPAAKWIACRNMDNGNGRPTSYIKCFEFFIAPFPRSGNSLTDGRPEMAPDVINNSWGCPSEEGCEGAEMTDVLVALKAAGIITVVSAGNEGSGCGTIGDQPATHSALTLSVGAHDHRSGRIASFSSRGPSKLDGAIGPDLTAPGVNIRSSVPGSRYEGGYSGTSMAGPHVVGGVALLLSVKPQLKGNVQAVFDIMSSTAAAKTTSESCGGVPGSQVPNNTFGHGTMNVYKAATASF